MALYKIKEGSNITSSDSYSFHHTSWQNSGEDGDKGTRTSSDWQNSNTGGWTKTSEHSTNQNYGKKSSKRH